MRTRTLSLTLLALFVLVAGVAGVIVAVGEGSTVMAARGARAAARFRWSFPAGTKLVYDLDWSTQQNVPGLGPAAVEGSLALAGQLELRAYGRRGDAWLVEARLAPTTRQLVVAGQDVLATPGALGDASAWAELDDDGRLRAVEVAPAATAAWQNLATALLSQLEVVVPSSEAATWTATQRGPFGRGGVSYLASAPRELVRVRAPYDVLDGLPVDDADDTGRPRGEGHVTLGDGWLGGLDEVEHLEVRRADGGLRLSGAAHLALKLVSVGHFDVDARAASASRKRLAPGERIVDVDAARQALVERVAGLTAEQLLAGVLVQAGGAIPDEDQWMWRATGLLRLQPELCALLSKAFTGGQLSRDGRALALDLLAGAGSAEAQAAMRAALGSPAAHENAGDWPRLVQRLSFLDKPTADTVAFARTLRQEARAAADTDGERAAAYVLGNLAGSLGAAGDAGGADCLAGELASDLGRAADAHERAALLTAYGAAERPGAAEVAARYLADTDADVRRAAVDAVAKAPGAHAESLLTRLAADSDAMVQSAAFAALTPRTLGADTLTAIGSLVTSGGLARVNDLSLAAFAAEQRRRGADLTPLAPALAAIVARSDDPQVKALLR